MPTSSATSFGWHKLSARRSLNWFAPIQFVQLWNLAVDSAVRLERDSLISLANASSEMVLVHICNREEGDPEVVRPSFLTPCRGVAIAPLSPESSRPTEALHARIESVRLPNVPNACLLWIDATWASACVSHEVNAAYLAHRRQGWIHRCRTLAEPWPAARFYLRPMKPARPECWQIEVC